MTAHYLALMSNTLRSERLAKMSIKADLVAVTIKTPPSIVTVQNLLQSAPSKYALCNVALLMDHLSELTQRDAEGLMAYFDRRMQELKERAAPQPEMELTQ